MNELERVFLDTVSREDLFPSGSTVCAAVSGGADSVAMLHLLVRFSPTRKWQLNVLHVNHGLRSGSDEEQAFVEELSESLSVPVETVRLEGRCGDSEGSWSAARNRLYGSRRELVAVGHNARDRAETVLLRLVEGSGLRGLGGMDYRGRGNVRRPMLDMDRDEIREWLDRRGFLWKEDPTNTDTGPARNRMRLEVLPALLEAFPDAVRGLCRSGKILSGWRDVQEFVADLFPEERIERDKLLALPEALSALVLWNGAGGPRGGFEEFMKVLRWLRGGGSGEHLLPGGRKLVVSGNSVTITERGPGRF